MRETPPTTPPTITPTGELSLPSWVAGLVAVGPKLLDVVKIEMGDMIGVEILVNVVGKLLVMVEINIGDLDISEVLVT